MEFLQPKEPIKYNKYLPKFLIRFLVLLVFVMSQSIHNKDQNLNETVIQSISKPERLQKKLHHKRENSKKKRK